MENPNAELNPETVRLNEVYENDPKKHEHRKKAKRISIAKKRESTKFRVAQSETRDGYSESVSESESKVRVLTDADTSEQANQRPEVS